MQRPDSAGEYRNCGCLGGSENTTLWTYRGRSPLTLPKSKTESRPESIMDWVLDVGSRLLTPLANLAT